MPRSGGGVGKADAHGHKEMDDAPTTSVETPDSVKAEVIRSNGLKGKSGGWQTTKDYTREQLDKWQADWNAYFAKYGMETPAYAHRITAAKKDEPGKADGVGSTLAA